MPEAEILCGGRRYVASQLRFVCRHSLVAAAQDCDGFVGIIEGCKRHAIVRRTHITATGYMDAVVQHDLWPSEATGPSANAKIMRIEHRPMRATCSSSQAVNNRRPAPPNNASASSIWALSDSQPVGFLIFRFMIAVGT
jgi:hypothetical protein